MDVLSISLLLL